MKDLIIVGAGSAAREYLQFAKDINAISPTFNIKGFIADSGVDIKDKTNNEYEILGTIVEWEPSENEVFVCAIADPIGKRKVVNLLLEKGANFVNLIHPTAKICDYSKVGKGLVMYPNSLIGVNSEVGDFVTVAGEINHDNKIADYVTLSGGAVLSGFTEAGEASFFGARSVVAPHLTIGKESFVGIGSVVINNVMDNTKVFGNPARKVAF